MLEQRTSAGLGSVRSPRAVAGHHVAGRPVLVVAQACSPWAGRARRLSTVRRNRFTMGWNREWKPTWAVRPEAATASQRTTDLVEGRGERLLAEERLSCVQGGPDQIEMAGRGGGDHDGLDGRVGDDVEGVVAHPAEGAVALRRPRRASADGSAAATATISPSSASFRRPSAWTWPIIPQPTRPTARGPAGDGPSGDDPTGDDPAGDGRPVTVTVSASSVAGPVRRAGWRPSAPPGP